jgi:NTE family protein
MTPRSRVSTLHAQTVFVFQGGGALGAYQAGVYEALHRGGFAPHWLVGTSIGAINAAIVAGNPPKHRLERLRAFWDRVTQKSSFGLTQPSWSQPWLAGLRTWQTLVGGVPGFFQARTPTPWDLARVMPLTELSFYDTAPLRQTLLDLVDFDYLNQGETRLTLCAVSVNTGRMARFDNRGGKREIRPEHIMASGALPPGFAPVLIDDEPYWDGGIYSNTPLDIVLDDAERRDTLCFMVDLWDASESAPHSLSEAMTRLKDIQYASRSQEHIADHTLMQNLRRAIRVLGTHLDAKTARHAELQALLQLGCDHLIDIVHLVMKAMPGEDSLRDIDFSRETMLARWQAGVDDGQRALRHKRWLAPPPGHVGMRVHTLSQNK